MHCLLAWSRSERESHVQYGSIRQTLVPDGMNGLKNEPPTSCVAEWRCELPSSSQLHPGVPCSFCSACQRRTAEGVAPHPCVPHPAPFLPPLLLPHPPPLGGSMVKFSKTLHVAASRPRCFELLRDWSRASSWDPAIVESSRQAGQPADAFGAGTKWLIMFKPSPDAKPMSVDYTTTKYEVEEAKSTLVFSGNATFVRSVDTLELTDAPAADGTPGTDVNYTADVRLRYLLAPFSFTLQGKMDEMAEPAMEGLQKFCDKNLL
ncbi:hypothetical protein I4F81_005101 [Pyropia yezoensis]|uniref:Uncharacterized protein n=1 Tax=Pyropia yezoensis TaxID=2788 RepID=A0ACC3BY76_PYRYE|nr:hypothetical protein I4F81_005101 [Neopyropia yezoensis]